MSTLSTLSIFEGAQDAQEDRKLSNKIMKALKMLKIPTLGTFPWKAPNSPLCPPPSRCPIGLCAQPAPAPRSRIELGRRGVPRDRQTWGRL